MSDPDAISVRFGDKASQTIRNISKRLGTTPEDVVSQTMILFTEVQGKKVILHDDKTNIDWVSEKYLDKPAKKGS